MRAWRGLGMLATLVGLGCGQPLPTSETNGSRELKLLHTSDLHSRVWPFPERIDRFEAELGLGATGSLSELGGFARLAHVLEEQSRQGARLWLDSGDALEGAEVFERFSGRLELELLSRLGLAAMALGNHELSLSASELARALEGAAFPVLAANALPESGSPLAGRLAAGTLLEADGVRLGVVGVANPTSPPGVGRAGNAWGLEVTADVAAAVQLALDDLAPRADLLVVLSHLGLERDRELVQGTTGIDLVLGGHQHLVTAEPEWLRDCGTRALFGRCSARRVPVVHSGAYGKLVARLNLRLARAARGTAGWEVEALELELLPLAAATPLRPDIVELLEPLRAPVRPPLAFLPEVLPRRSALGGDSPLGNFTVDALQAASGADVVLLNSSGLRADLEPGVLLPAELTLAFPFAEPWLLTWASGRDLRQGLSRAAQRSAARGCESTLQVAGLRLRIDCQACQRDEACVDISRVTPWGELALRDDELLLVCLPEYLAQPEADFAALSAASPSSVAVLPALERQLARLPRVGGAAPCRRALRALSTERCRSAFGELACPLDAVHAASACHELARLTGGRDGRVQMLP